MNISARKGTEKSQLQPNIRKIIHWHLTGGLWGGKRGGRTVWKKEATLRPGSSSIGQKKEHNLQSTGPKSLISKQAWITEPNTKNMLISISDKLSPQKFNKARSDQDKYILTGRIFKWVLHHNTALPEMWPLANKINANAGTSVIVEWFELWLFSMFQKIKNITEMVSLLSSWRHAQQCRNSTAGIP